MDIETQPGIEDFSQNTMPSSKRARTSSRSSSRSRSVSAKRATSSRKTHILPYAKKGNGPMWDPFPNRQVAILRYATQINLVPTVAGVAAVHQFRANGIYDPDLTGVGHQPYGHDQYEQIYNNYRVIKSTITITPTASFNGTFGCLLSDDTSIPSGYDAVKETKGSTFANIVNNGGTVPTVVQTYKRGQAFSPHTSADGAAFGSSPADQQIFAVWKTEQTDTTSPQSSLVLVTISYIVEMYELKTFSQS